MDRRSFVQPGRGRDVAALVYAVASVVIFGARLVYIVVRGNYRTPGAEFFLLVCVLGLGVGLVGSIYLGVKLRGGRRSSS